MVRGRPKQFDESVALASAMDVFWKRGYEDASCDELLDAMGINCGSMYSTFGDKHTLYEQAFDLYVESVGKRVYGIINGTDSPLQNLHNLIDYWGEFLAHPDHKGCLVINSMTGTQPENEEITLLARKLIRELQSTVEDQLRQAQVMGELRASVDPAELAAFIINNTCGMCVMSRAGAGRKHIESVTKAMHALLA